MFTVMKKFFLKQATKKPHFLFFLLILLHCLDMITTQVGINTGFMQELNPAADFILQSYGFTGLWVVKIIIALLTTTFLWAYRLENIMYIALMGYFAVVMWNYYSTVKVLYTIIDYFGL